MDLNFISNKKKAGTPSAPALSNALNIQKLKRKYIGMLTDKLFLFSEIDIDNILSQHFRRTLFC